MIRNRLPRGFALILLFLACTGCAPSLKTIVFDKANANVKTIAYLTPAVPVRAVITEPPQVSTSPLGSLIVLAIDASVHGTHWELFNQTLIAQHYSPLPLLEQDVAQVLSAHGYAVIPQPVARSDTALSNVDNASATPPDFLPSYPPTTADAYLDVVLSTYGYAAAGSMTPFQPNVQLKYRLIRVADGTILMQGRFGYSVFGSDQRPPKQYDYWDGRAFAKDPTGTVAGISEGLAAGAQAIGTTMQ